MIRVFDCNHHVNSFSREDALNPSDKYTEAISDSAVGFKDGVYAFVFTYPLSREAHFLHQLTPEMSWIDLLLLAQADYQEIYRREDEECGPTGNIPGMLNRDSSDGPFGIWGHHITDLYFERVEVDEEQRVVNFGIGS